MDRSKKTKTMGAVIAILIGICGVAASIYTIPEQHSTIRFLMIASFCIACPLFAIFWISDYLNCKNKNKLENIGKEIDNEKNNKIKREEEVFKQIALEDINLRRDTIESKYGDVRNNRQPAFNAMILPICIKLRGGDTITTEESGNFLAALEHPLFIDLIDKSDHEKYLKAKKKLTDQYDKEHFLSENEFKYGIGLSPEDKAQFFKDKRASEIRVRKYTESLIKNNFKGTPPTEPFEMPSNQSD
jgi:hypothetical protein